MIYLLGILIIVAVMACIGIYRGFRFLIEDGLEIDIALSQVPVIKPHFTIEHHDVVDVSFTVLYTHNYEFSLSKEVSNDRKKAIIFAQLNKMSKYLFDNNLIDICETEDLYSPANRINLLLKVVDPKTPPYDFLSPQEKRRKEHEDFVNKNYGKISPT